MFMITNRHVDSNAPGLEKFADKPNSEGPNELRLAEVQRNASGEWDAEILNNELSPQEKKALGLPKSKPAFRSQYVADKLLKSTQSERRNLLLFVHGFNNDVKAVLDRSEKLSTLYNLEVVPFSWPANGGGIKGVASYKSDKRDARASAGALSRVFELTRNLLESMNEGRIKALHRKMARKFKDNDNEEERQIWFARENLRGCPYTVNLMCHSMGNYIFKQVLSSSVYEGRRLLFDNVVLAAADVNNADHAIWVDQINCRRRTYIAINEDDSALLASRMKFGDEQLARLGHYPHNLNSNHAVYVDFTEAAEVDSSHAYFEDAAVADENSQAYKFFRGALNGERVERALRYDDANNLYRVR
jgi:esterase/lipase superfamily enzyme